MSHWSKSRQVQYEECPRKYFFGNIAAKMNPQIEELGTRQSEPLVRHEAVRKAVLAATRESAWSPAHTRALLEQCQVEMIGQLGNEAAANAQMSLIQRCVEGYIDELRDALLTGTVEFISNGEPVEFIFDDLAIMAAPEVVVRHADRIDIFQFKSGNADFAGSKERDLRLRAGALTCWARVGLREFALPVDVIDVYLRTKPLEMKRVRLTDGDLAAFVAEAKTVAPKLGVSAKIKDFPATPNSSACRFCDFKSVCEDYRGYFEVKYDIESLAAAAAAKGASTGAAQAIALVESKGEVRDVFLSHVSEDKAGIVEPFARALRAAGISYWLDEAELRWGTSLARGINRGLATSRCVVAFLSPEFLKRGWAQAELDTAITAHINKKTILLPLVIADRAAISAEYPMLADLKGKNWRDGIEDLVKDLRRVLKDT